MLCEYGRTARTATIYTFNGDVLPFPRDGIEPSIAAKIGNSGWLSRAAWIWHAFLPRGPAISLPSVAHASSVIRWTPSNRSQFAGDTIPSGPGKFWLRFWTWVNNWPALPTWNACGLHDIQHTERVLDVQRHRQTAACVCLYTWATMCFIHTHTSTNPCIQVDRCDMDGMHRCNGGA